jgi:hypothetical protein
MATIDSNIALGYRAPQFESPLTQATQAAQLGTAQQQNMLGRMQMAEMGRAAQQKNQMREILANADPSSPEINNLLRKAYVQSGDIAGLMAHDKTVAEAQAAQAKIGESKAKTKQAEAGTAKTEFELQKQKVDYAWDSVSKSRDPDAFAASIKTALDKKLISQEEADRGLANLAEAVALDTAQGGNQNFTKLRADALVNLLPAKDRYETTQPKYEFIDLDGKKVRVQTKSSAPGFDPNLKELKVVSTPHQLELEKLRRQELGLQKRRLDEELASGSPLTKDTLDFAAQLYTQTGQMPQVGMGKNAQLIRSQILTRAAEINMGGGASAADAAGKLVGNKIDVATKTKASKDFSTGVAGNRVTAFNTAIDHLATMDKLSDALQNNDTKLINSLGNTVARQTGQPAPTNFDAAKQIVTAEVIKAVVASGGGVTERQEAERNFAAANSPAQLKGLIRTYKELLGGQLNSLGVQYESTTGKKDFESKLTPDAKAEFKAVRSKGEPTAAGAVDTKNKWLK